MTSIPGAAWRSSRHSIALSLTVLVLTAGVVVTTLATAGRTVAAERAVLSTIDSDQLTVIEVLDDDGATQLDASHVSSVAGLSTVGWVVGLGPVEDVRPPGMPGAEPVASRRIVGNAPDLVWRDDLASLAAQVVRGPVGVAGPEARGIIGLDDSVGAVESFSGMVVPIVGPFVAHPPLDGLNTLVLVHDPAFDGPLRRITLQVHRPEDIQATASALHEVITGPGLRIEVADELARVRAAVQGELGGSGRQTVVQTMAAGLALTALVMYAALHAARKDFGRRRTLGATRTQLIAVVLGHVLLASTVGALLGAIAGTIAVWRFTGSGPGLPYPVAIAVIAVLINLLAATIPATVAALRDPVAALRVA